MHPTITILVVENAQLIPQRSKNSRIYSQSKNALRTRNYYISHPHALKNHNARAKEFQRKKRALKRALLESENSVNLAGAYLFCFLIGKEGKLAPERHAKGRILSQTYAAIQSRRYLKEHPQYYIQHLLKLKKQSRRKRAINLLETRMLRPEFKDRGDEFIEEYVECPDPDTVKLKWFLDDSFGT